MDSDCSDAEPDVLGQVQTLLIMVEERAKEYVRVQKEAREKEIGELRQLEKEIEERKRVENEVEMLRTKLKGKECKCKAMLDAIYVAGSAFLDGGTLNEGAVTGGRVVPQTGQNNNDTATSAYPDNGTTSFNDMSTKRRLFPVRPLTSSPMSTGFRPHASSSMSSMSSPDLSSRSTSQVYQDITELDSGFRKKLEPFHRKRKSHASNEKLSDLQRAYFNYRLTQCDQVRSTAEKARAIFKDGVKERMWAHDYGFERYLNQRLKNQLTCVQNSKRWAPSRPKD